MWKAIILLCALVSLTAGDTVSFENHKVCRLIPESKEQLIFLKHLIYKEKDDEGLAYWKPPTEIGSSVEIIIPPRLKGFLQFCEKVAGLPPDCYIDDVQELINNTINKNQSSSFDFNSFHTLDEIYKNLDDLAEEYPDNVQVIVGGQTYEGRQIKGVKISTKPNNPGVFLEGGINSRQWMSPAVTMYIIHQLLNSKDSYIRYMSQNYDWYIFPSFNPDGYVYTHTTNRLWQKTLSKDRGQCRGANPNKNWGYYAWDSTDSIYSPCSNLYPGPIPLSEIETNSMSRYIESIQDKLQLYLSFSSYEHEFSLLPKDRWRSDHYMEIFKYIGDHAYQKPLKYNTYNYNMLKNVKQLHSYDGTSVNYIKNRYKKSFVAVYGLYDITDHKNYSFLQPPQQIVTIGNDTVYTLAKMLKERGHPSDMLELRCPLRGDNGVRRVNKNNTAY